MNKIKHIVLLFLLVKIVYPSLAQSTKTYQKNHRIYECSNHLGNVSETVSDKPAFISTGLVASNNSYSDYYPYGMQMVGRNESTSSYRYGFQGQEKDDEVKGRGNSVNYKYRMHDPRVGKFFAVDPLDSKYPHYSPYGFSGNRLIAHVELEGREDIYFDKSFLANNGKAVFDLYASTDIGKESIERFKKTEPNGDDPGNQGYDIVYVAAVMTPGNKGQVKQIMSNDETLTNVHTGKEITPAEAMRMEEEGDEKQAAWNKAQLGDIIYDNAKESLKKGRGVIVIHINEDLLKKSAVDSKAEITISRTVGHELDFHAVNDSREIDKSQNIEHGENTGNYGKGTPVEPVPGTRDYKMTEQIKEKQKERDQKSDD